MPRTDLTNQDAVALSAMVRSRDISPVEIAEAALAAIDALDPRAQRFLHACTG
jgi:Asp-tRNA(Asn)/Glu-tRNA(Gln) amidotransferase A subunit family amidase